MIKPTPTPKSVAELEANITQSRASRARYLLDMRHDARAARRAAAELDAERTPQTVGAILDRAELDELEIARTRADLGNVRRIRTAGAACARAERYERTIAQTWRYGYAAFGAARTPAELDRIRALAADLRRHARNLPARA